MIDRPWPPGTATGLGSLPGTDPDEAVRLVLGEVPELPYLPELPERGVGADMIGRTGSLLVDLPLEWQLHGWTVADRGGRDRSRASDLLQRDLDALTEQGQDLDVVKLQVCGPMTMAANIELPNLHKVLTDPGAFRDLAASLAEGTRLHLADLRSRLPGTRIVLQVDEPGLPAVLAGTVPTPSGYGTVRSMAPSIAQPALAAVLDAAEPAHRVVHCCAAEVPFDLLRGAGALAIAVDFSLLGKRDLDAIGELIDAGGSLWLGVAPGVDTEISSDQLRNKITSMWQRLGFAMELLPDRVVPTPACGLSGASMSYVRRVMSVLRETGHSLTG
ncbi:MAG: hypothetical protein QOE71_2980 [Pseudonocardiales bacterium]|nr:hypothetical protein [Pseudonocardiales bacterium]